MNKWISVHYDLPPMNKEVIVLTDNIHGKTVNGANCICFGHIVNTDEAVDYDGWNIPGVHHWMPCPPIEGEDDKRYMNPTRGYDPEYLQSCIDKATKSWEGVDVDDYLDKVRGRDDAPTSPDFDTEVYNWLREHGNDETRQLIEMTARHFWEMERGDDRMVIGNLSKYGFTVHDEMICCDAVTTFGVENQLDMVIEECAELIDAIQKYRRNRVERAEVITEIADVEIMCQQLRACFGSNEVATERDRKIKRLAERISKHNKEIKEE